MQNQTTTTTSSTKKKSKLNLPNIPNKRYFTIGEVSTLCILKTHVLRYWEQEFPQLKPNKRRGNRRYYQYKDVIMIRKIRELLYEKGFTIQGARKELQNNREKKQTKIETSHIIKECIAELKSIQQLLLGE